MAISSRWFAIVLLLAGPSLSACLIEIPDHDTSHAVVTWWPLLGTDERDFNSTCSHFGNETPSSQKPYHRC
jgi:hypothetical protein